MSSRTKKQSPPCTSKGGKHRAAMTAGGKGCGRARRARGGYEVDGLWSARLAVWVGLDTTCRSTLLGVGVAVAEGLV